MSCEKLEDEDPAELALRAVTTHLMLVVVAVVDGYCQIYRWFSCVAVDAVFVGGGGLFELV